MHRIDSDTNVASLPTPAAPGTPGYFSEGNPGPGTPVPATNLTQDWCNTIQEELVAIPADQGISLNKTTNNQVLAALKLMLLKQGPNYGVDSGTANHYILALTPTVNALYDGMKVRWVPAHTNTGASDLQIGSAAAKTILRPNGGALLAGDIVSTGIAEAMYVQAADKFYLIMAPALVGVPTRQVLTSGSGATYTTPVGCRQLKIRMVGAGGGGGTGADTGTPVTGTAGNRSIFNSVNAEGGSGGIAGNASGDAYGGKGGQGGTGTASWRSAGQGGGPGSLGPTSPNVGASGGQGGSSVMGGGQKGGVGGDTDQPGYGGGGSGGQTGNQNQTSGGGGGGGEYVELIINSPASTYTYTVGTGGAGGSSANTFAGGSGLQGVIIVDEIY